MGEIEAARRFFEPSKGEHERGWWKGRQNERVTCRPLRLPKDHILGLRSCLASPQNPSCINLYVGGASHSATPQPQGASLNIKTLGRPTCKIPNSFLISYTGPLNFPGRSRRVGDSDTVPISLAFLSFALAPYIWWSETQRERGNIHPHHGSRCRRTAKYGNIPSSGAVEIAPSLPEWLYEHTRL